MCGSMVDIQSKTAENRRGKKKERTKKPQLQNIMSAYATQGGRHKRQLNYKYPDMAQQISQTALLFDINLIRIYMSLGPLHGHGLSEVAYSRHFYTLRSHFGTVNVINFSSTWYNNITSGYATMVNGRGCNPHRSTTTFANLKIMSLWRHWWRHNSETIRDMEKRRPPRAMKSSELSNGETASLYDNVCKSGNDVIDDVIIWVQDGNCKRWLERILVLVRCTI